MPRAKVFTRSFPARSPAVRITPNKHLRKTLALTALLASCASPRVPLAFPPSSPAAHATCLRPAAFIVLGDSLGAGYGASSPARGISGLAEGDLRKRYPHIRVQNLSIPGADTGKIARVEVPAMHVAPCTLVLLIAGANDVQEYHLPPRFNADFGELLDAIRRRDRNAALVVAGLPDIALSPRIPAIAKPLVAYLSKTDDAVIARQSREHGAAFAAVFELSKRAAASGRVLLSRDRLHPNDAGYAIMATAILPAVRRESALTMQK